MKKLLFKKGFTLVELLVVIAIIAILTSIVMANFTTAKSKARDAKRISDIAQLQLTLEQAFDRCNICPTFLDLTTDVCPGFNLGYFISVLPRDPSTQSVYEYTPNGSKTDYVLRAKLENKSSALDDDFDGDASWTTGGHCNDGPAGTPPLYYYCVRPN